MKVTRFKFDVPLLFKLPQPSRSGRSFCNITRRKYKTNGVSKLCERPEVYQYNSMATSKSRFLNWKWRNLVMLNYEVDPEILKPYLPAATELDLWEGKALVSMVGFMFKDTRVLGIKWPFHVNFEEVNLRFYVRHFDGKEWKRGTVFVSEIVPKKR
jgi:hypothetical protein